MANDWLLRRAVMRALGGRFLFLVTAGDGGPIADAIGAGRSRLRDERSREAALITFLVTLSGLTLWGVGSAFWGVVAGALALAVQRQRLFS